MRNFRLKKAASYDLYKKNLQVNHHRPSSGCNLIPEEGEPAVKPGKPKKEVRFSPGLKTVGIAAGTAVSSAGRARKRTRANLDPSGPSPLSRYARNKRSLSMARAARDGLVDVVQSHLKSEVNIANDVDEDGFTAMHHAARYNRLHILECLVEAGASVNVKGPEDICPLHLACRYNSDMAVQFLLSQGAEINPKDSKGKTPLHYATRRGHDLSTKMLLSVNACNVNAADNDLTSPLHMAAVQGNASICELLISRGATIGSRDINDMTALMWAAAEGHMQVIELLLKLALRLGSNDRTYYVRANDNEGSTALHLAVQNGNLEVCQVLLDNFADVNSQKYNFTTPLHLAATMGFTDIGQLLIMRGADVNRRDADQIAPVHKAALYNKVDMLKLLMSHGADLNAKDKKNKSPLHCACWKGQTDTIRFLLDSGAQVAEVDSSLMTPLHWAVQFCHYESLMVLLKHSGSNLLEATDKNDQTVLHYAAHTGNVTILKTLLDHGARPDAKDQEEHAPLHIAAQFDNVSCVEALNQASGHETNDDDLEGRTPLLLGSLHGHHQVVLVLLSLGADISNRDDEHRTALMLAAAEGHTMVMKILLDNHAAVNEVDKLKNSALHYACSGGFVEAVQMLLDKRANVTLKNTHDQSPICLAIHHSHNDVAVTMLKHKSWRDCMSLRSKNGRTVLDKLIARLPDAAQVVLDHCMERSTRDDEDVNLSMVFDYQYIDPGPDDPASSHKSYFALNTMVEYGRDALLSHPLCQSCLAQKWVKFGGPIFYFNLSIYIGYLIMLTLYTAMVGQPNVLIKESPDGVTACSMALAPAALLNGTNVSRNGQLAENALKIKDPLTLVIGGFLMFFIALLLLREASKVFTQLDPDRRKLKDPGLFAVEAFLILFLCAFAVREASKIFLQRWKYFINVFNLIALFLICSTYVFCHPLDEVPCLHQWRAGWMALFLAWINFIMYLRRIDFVGIYVIMFVAVLVSLLKAVLIYFFFCLAFAGSFYVMLSKQPTFSTLGTAVVNIFVMTLGEIEYGDNFLNTEDGLGPFEIDAHILLVLFLFLMPVVLMNLMIGIAVGDIEKIQRNAYLKRIALQVGLLYDLENTMPLWLKRKVHLKRAVVKPNEDTGSHWQAFKRALFGSSKEVQFITAEKEDKTQMLINSFHRELHQQQNKVKNLQLSVQQQTQLLTQIASKLNCDTGVTAETSSLQQDNLSLYDNMAVQLPARRGSRWGRGRPFSFHK